MNTIQKIKYMFFDVDGTLTDGKIYMGNDGELFKAFDIKDGCAIHDILPELGILPVVITARYSKIVENRCKELNIEHCYQGVRNKKGKMLELLKSWGVTSDENEKFQEVAYVGDDIIDLPCMEICGFSACPKDAVEEVKQIATYISRYAGGNGVVRDIVEMYGKSVCRG